MRRPPARGSLLGIAMVGMLAVLMPFAAATTARAAAYGELSHVKLKLTLSLKTHGFGVDPSDDSVYVVDTPSSGVFRMQKLSAGGEPLASVSFTPPKPLTVVEGVAVDSQAKRVYVLAGYRRSETSAIDPRLPAAGTLYAFSTEASGGKLLPASGTGVEGVLVNESVFAAQSEAQGQALLEPRGIAVDPATHDVIVLGAIDEGEVGGEPQLRVALQRVTEAGALGERYVDAQQLFAEELPNSPVVSQTGDVFVQEFDQLVQIPSNFSSTASPAPVYAFETEGLHPEELLEFDTPTTEPPEQGGGMSLSPEGAGNGVIYTYGRIREDEENGQKYPGVLAFGYATQGASVAASELGWTGGESKRRGLGKCTIGINSINPSYPMVAAGKGSLLFVFDPSVPQVVELGPGGEGCPNAEASEPVASIDGRSLSPSETVSPGTPVTLSSTVKQANALSVEWSFGEGEKTPQIVSSDEHQHTEVTHTFARGGQLTVTETIHTDDLATPTIVEQTKIAVAQTAPPPTAVLEGPTEVTLGGGIGERLAYNEDGGLELIDTPSHGEASFDASASYASTAAGANRIETYHWTFGDGHTEATTAATVAHTYAQAGAYRVELTVTDAHGLSSEPVALTVVVKNAPPPGPGAGAGAGPLGAPTTATVQTPAGPPASGGAPGGGGPGAPTVPDVVLRGTRLTVGRSGTVALALACPSGASGCAGTVTLRAQATGGARVSLAAGTFAIHGGRAKTVVLRLTHMARALLARVRVLRAQATIVAHDPAGAVHITRTPITLRVTKLRTK